MATTPETPAGGWISTRHVRHMIVRGDAAGLPMDAVLGEGGLRRAQLGDADGAVPIAAIEAMLGALSRRSADALVGLRLARELQPATLGPLGYILQTCSTFGELLESLTRYNGFLSDVGTTAVRVTSEGVEVGWTCSAGAALFRRHATEYVLAAVVGLARRLVSERRPLVRRVCFAHPAPARVELLHEHASCFGGPVAFDAPRSAVVLAPEVWRAPLRHADAGLKRLFESHAQAMLRQRERRRTLADAVRHRVEASLREGLPAKERVAAELGLSPRSLHRKLQALGTGYRRIVDEARLDLARERLRESRDSIEAIALGLGFGSRQAFLRWFKRAAGTTPGAWRQRTPVGGGSA